MIYRTSPRTFPYLILFLIAFWGLQINSAHAQCSFTVPPGSFCAGDNCSASIVPFTPVGTTAADKYQWDFGDTNSQADTSNKQSPTFIYSKPGTYTVTLKVNGGAPCTQQVTVNGFDEFTIDPDENKNTPLEEEICKADLADGITLSAKFKGTKPANPTYLWSNGATTPTLTIDSAGCYSVKITDPASGCSRTNKITITSYKPDPNEPPPPAKETGRWYFGSGAGIKFVGGKPEPVTDGQINVTQGSSTVSDLSGKLLFYTDGKNIYRPDGTIMPGGDNLNGGANITQGVLIVAQPGCASCNSVYYVFTISDTGEMKYSIVDMRGEDGKGTVQATEKNLSLPSSPITTTERVTAVEAEPDSVTGALKTWIITHDANTNIFRVYPFTGQGLGKPDTSRVGALHGSEAVKGEGYMKVSPDGTKVAVVIPGVDQGANNMVQLFDFDKKTGKLSNPKNIDLGKTPPAAYGVEFSSDTTLYVSLTGDGTATNPSQLLQFSVRSSDTITIANSKKIVATAGLEGVPVTDKFGALQIDPDHQKIYMAVDGNDSLAVINQPNDTLKVGFQHNGAALGGKASQLGLPNISPTETPPGFGQGFSFDGPACTPKGVPVTYKFDAHPDRAERNDGVANSHFTWTFPNAPNEVKTDANSITHTFPGPGTYIVKLTIVNDCQTEVITPKTVTIKQAPDPFKIQPNAPNIRQGATISTCQPSVTLDAQAQANAPGSKYQWFVDGVAASTGQTLVVTKSGTYSVNVVNGTCGKTDLVTVTFTSPKPDLGPDISFCGGAPFVPFQLDSKVPNATSYAWTANGVALSETGQSIDIDNLPSVTTTYRVSVTTGQGCPPSTDEVIVSVGTVPVFPADANITIKPTAACGGTIGSGSIDLGAAQAGVSYSWQGRTETEPKIDSLVAGAYSVTITNTTTGCKASKSFEVKAAVSAINATTVITHPTCTVPTGYIQITATGGTSYKYFIGGKEVFLTGVPLAIRNLSAGFYDIEVRDNVTACSKFLVNQEIINPVGMPVINASIKITGCRAATLKVNLADLTGTITYEWTLNDVPFNTPPNNPPILVSLPGSYKVKVTQNGCSTTSQPLVLPATLDPNAIDIVGPTNACEGDEVTLTAKVPAGSAYLYQWQNENGDIPGANGSALTVDVTGKYFVLVTDQNTCSNRNEVASTLHNVSFNSIPEAQLDLAKSILTVCSGDVVTLAAMPVEDAFYSWTYTDGKLIGSGQVVKFPSVKSAGFRLTVTNKNNPTCGTQVEGSFTVNPKPKVDFSKEPTTFCDNSFMVLHATNPVGSTYKWTKDGVVLAGRTQDTLHVNHSGKYSVVVTLGECTFEAEHNVNPPQKSPVPNPPRKQVPFCFDDTENPGALAPVDAGQGNLLYYDWYILGSDLTGAPIDTGQITFRRPEIYVVKYRNYNDPCFALDTISVFSQCEPRVFIPEAFSPNGDGTNDQFILRHVKYLMNLEVKIYNRWGEVILATKIANPPVDINGDLNIWDGTFNGQPCPVGSYVWAISYNSETIADMPTVKRRGGIALIR
ncbi:MAG: PKD domain-containing protein [Bacteroidota bacterium]